MENSTVTVPAVQDNEILVSFEDKELSFEAQHMSLSQIEQAKDDLIGYIEDKTGLPVTFGLMLLQEKVQNDKETIEKLFNKKCYIRWSFKEISEDTEEMTVDIGNMSGTHLLFTLLKLDEVLETEA